MRQQSTRATQPQENASRVWRAPPVPQVTLAPHVLRIDSKRSGLFVLVCCGDGDGGDVVCVHVQCMHCRILQLCRGHNPWKMHPIGCLQACTTAMQPVKAMTQPSWSSMRPSSQRSHSPLQTSMSLLSQPLFAVTGKGYRDPM